MVVSCCDYSLCKSGSEVSGWRWTHQPFHLKEHFDGLVVEFCDIVGSLQKLFLDDKSSRRHEPVCIGDGCDRQAYISEVYTLSIKSPWPTGRSGNQPCYKSMHVVNSLLIVPYSQALQSWLANCPEPQDHIDYRFKCAL